MQRFFLFILFASVILLSCNAPKENTEFKEQNVPGNCTYARNEKAANGSQIRVVNSEKFTSQAFEDTIGRGAAAEDEFFKGYLSCVSVDTVLGVYFDFKVYSEDAFQFYGIIKKNNKITFILKSGKAVELSFGNTISGSTNLSSNSTEYSSFARISGSDAEKLVSEELERVRISWSKKDEEYKVVNPRILINQLPCVKE